MTDLGFDDLKADIDRIKHLIGALELPDELQDKIEEFEELVEAERKKRYFG